MYRYTFRGIEYIETEEGQLKWVTEDRNCRFTCHVDHIDDEEALVHIQDDLGHKPTGAVDYLLGVQARGFVLLED